MWLKLQERSADKKDLFNMAHVYRIESDGTGHAKLLYENGEWIITVESKETVEDMLDAAIRGYPGVVSEEDAFEAAR